jgi:hypothetical protein
MHRRMEDIAPSPCWSDGEEHHNVKWSRRVGQHRNSRASRYLLSRPERPRQPSRRDPKTKGHSDPDRSGSFTPTGRLGAFHCSRRPCGPGPLGRIRHYACNLLSIPLYRRSARAVCRAFAQGIAQRHALGWKLRPQALLVYRALRRPAKRLKSRTTTAITSRR